ncbi:MAG: uroporphyrinogen-III decarboxylase, partial [Spirochaetota bacterium]
MTSRERVLKAARHEETDRVPLFYRDVPEVETRLLRDLGVTSRDELLELLEIDFRWVAPLYVGPPLEDRVAGRQKDIWAVEYSWIEAGHGGQWEPVAFPLEGIEDPLTLDDYPWPQVEWFDFSAVSAQL